MYCPHSPCSDIPAPYMLHVFSWQLRWLPDWRVYQMWFNDFFFLFFFILVQLEGGHFQEQTQEYARWKELRDRLAADLRLSVSKVVCLTLSNLYLLFCLNNISVKFVVFIAIYKVKNEIHEMQNVSSLSSSKMKSKFVTFANVCAKKHLVMHIRYRKNAENEVGKTHLFVKPKPSIF